MSAKEKDALYPMIIKDYEEVKKYIHEQVAVRRDGKNVSKGPPKIKRK